MSEVQVTVGKPLRIAKEGDRRYYHEKRDPNSWRAVYLFTPARFYAYKDAQIYDVSSCDDASLGLLSDLGFLFTSIADSVSGLHSETELRLQELHKQWTGHSTRLNREYLLPILEKHLKQSPPYFRSKVEVPKTGTMVSLCVDPGDVTDLPKQAVGILVCLNNNGGVLEKNQLISLMGDYIKTRQPMSEIFRFYQKKLIASEYIEVEEKK